MENKDKREEESAEEMELALTILLGYCEIAQEAIDELKVARDKMVEAQKKLGEAYGMGT